MILFDRKKALSQILGPNPNEQQKQVIDALQAITEELVGAIHDKNIDGVKSSLKAAFAEIKSADTGNMGDTQGGE